MRTLRMSINKVYQFASERIRTSVIYALLFATTAALAGCSKGSNGSAIDMIFGALSDSPILSAVPTQVLQQTQELSVDVNNVKETSTGSDKDMSYSCRWSRLTGAPVTEYADCSTLPNGSATFATGSGQLKWTPSTSELGQFQFEITGTNKAGSDRREFVADVRLAFNGLESLTAVQGDRMTLNWTPNPNATGYQILRKNADGTTTVFHSVTDPTLGTVTLTNLVPLSTYAFRVAAIDTLGATDGNAVTLSAVTADLIRLEVTAAASELSPGQSTTVTVRLKDNGGNYLTTSGLSVGFAQTGSGTSAGTFSATTDLGNGVYTSVFTATAPGTANPITASLPQYYYVEQTAAMTVRPLQVEILASAAKVNPNRTVTLTARIHDFTGALMSQGGHALAFTYASGTSTASIAAALDLGTGTYTATLTGLTAGTAVTLGATLSTTSTIYSTTTVQVVPYTIEIAAALTDVSVTRSTTVTAKVKDWQGAYVTAGGQGLAFQLVGSTGILTLGSTTDNGDGTYRATITGLSLGTVVVSASMTPSFSVAQTATVTVRKLRLEISSSASRLMPTQTATLTGKVKDWQGTVIGVGGQSFDFSASAGTSSGSIGTVTDLGTGVYTATFTAGTAGTPLTISGSISETYQVDVTSAITVEKWRVYVAVSSSTVSTGQAVQATVTVKDYNDVQATAGGQIVSVSLSGGTSSGAVGAVTDNGNGTYAAPITGITTGSAMTVTAALTQSYQVIQTASLTVGSIHLAVTVQNARMNPAGTSYVYAQVKDASGTNLTGGSYTINFSYTGGTSTGTFSAVSNLGNGLYRAQFTGAVGGTPITITAASATTTFVVDSTQTIEVVPWSLRISSPSTTVTVGQSVVLTGRIYNYQNQPVTSGGQGFAMSLATSGVGSLSAVADNNDGTYSATFTASGLGSSAVAGTVTSSYSLDSTVTLTTTTLHISVTVQNAQMNPGGSSYVYAQLRDAAGGLLTLGSYSINFSYSGGTSTGTFSTVTNLGGGLYRATFTGATGGTPVAISASSATTAFDVDSTQTIEVVPWSLKITAPATAITLGQTVQLTGKVYDFTGALVTTGGKGFAMNLATSGTGNLSSVTDNNDGTYTTTFTATASGSTLVNGSISASYALTSTVTLVTSDLHLAVTVQNARVNPGGTSYVYVQTKTASGANISGGSYSLTFSNSGGTSTGAFGAVTSLGGGLYRATFTASTGGTPTTISASSATSAFVVDSTQTIEVVPWALKITASSSAVTVGQSVTLTGKVYDHTGALVTTGGKGFAMSLATTGVGTLSAVIDNNDGSYSASFAATGVGSTSVNGNITSSFTLASTVTLVSTAVHLSLSVTQSYLNPGEGVVVTALVKDAAGNNLMSSGYTIGFTYSGGSSTGSLSSTINLGTGAYTSTFTGNIAGTATTITANASVPFVVDQTVDLTVMPWRIALAATTTSFAINETGTITASIKNWNNVTVTTGGKGISLALASSGIGAISSTTDNTDGTYAANFQATGVGTVQVTANMSQSYTVSNTLNLTVGKIYLVVTLGPSNLTAASVASGSTVVARVTINNSAGTKVTGTGYSLNLSASGGSSSVTADTALSEVSTGVYEMTYRGVTSGTALTLTASSTVPYISSATAALTVTPSSTISASNSNLVTASTTVRSGSAVTLTATLKDAAGNLVPGLTNVAFAKSTGAGVGAGTFSSVTDAGNGNYTTMFTGTSQGATPTTVTVSSGGVTVATSVNITVTSGSPSALTLSGPTATTGGTCSAPYYLSFFDGAGNATTLSSSASFTVSGLGYGVLYSDSGCSTAISTIDVPSGASGSNMFYLKSYYPGAYGLTFSASGITQTNTLTTTVTPVISWLGAAGTLDAYGTGNAYGLGFFDGTFQQAQGISLYNDGTNNYLMVTDQANHSLQKINVTSLSSISVVGALGRVNYPKGVPTGGTNSSYCTGFSSSLGVNGAYCTGGQYTSGNGDAMLNGPYKSTVMTISSVRYLFVSDTTNNRVAKYKADTGEFVGWTGYTTSATTSCLNGTSATTNTSANSATTGFCLGGTPSTPPTTYASGSTTGGNIFRSPTVITNDGTYLYVYDSGNARIVMLDPSSGQLVRWMGRLASSAVGGISGTGNGLSCLSNQSDNSSAADGYFTPSWCTGGYAIGTNLAQGSSSNIYLNPQWNTLRGIGFYSDGTYNWMAVVDSSTSRVIRYFCGAATATPNCNSTALVSITSSGNTASHGPGEYFGWTGWVNGTTVNSGGSVPASINSSVFFTTTAGSGSYTATNGWAYYGVSSGVNAQGSAYNPYGVLIQGTQLFTASVNSNRIDRLNLLTGVFNGWIGRISSTPSGGVSGCAGANAGSITPGWCVGGSAISGSATGAFGTPIDVVTDGTYLFVSDRDNFRISIHNLTSGAVIGSIGLRLNTQPTTWSTIPYAVGTVMPTTTTLKDWNTQRDRIFAYPDQPLIQGNYMYVSDTSNHRIKRYKWLDGSFAGWVGLTYSLPPTGGDEACVGALVGGFTPGWCQGGGFTNTSAFGFNNPRGLASDGTYLYVADTSNHRIVRLKLDDGSFQGWIGYIGTAPSDGDTGCAGASATVTPGWCLGGSGAATPAYQLGGFNAPNGLTGFTDTDNKFYLIVAETNNNRLQKIEAANPSNASFVGYTASAVPACSTAATSVTAQWCSQSGVSTTNTNTASPGYANNGALAGPRGITVDTSSTPYYVYVTNTNGRIQRFNATTGAFGGFIGMISTVGTSPGCQSGSQAANTVTPSWCTGGVTSAGTAGTIGQMSNTLNGLYSDGTYLYVSDTATNRIQRWNRSSGLYSGWVGRVLTTPTAGGSSCTSLSNGAITPTWCTGGTSKAGYLFDTTNMKSAFEAPHGITGMGAYLYVIDANNGRIVSLPKN